MTGSHNDPEQMAPQNERPVSLRSVIARPNGGSAERSSPNKHNAAVVLHAAEQAYPDRDAPTSPLPSRSLFSTPIMYLVFVSLMIGHGFE